MPTQVPPSTNTPLLDTRRVSHPKDARGIPVCELLSSAQLVELGLTPETAKPDSGGATQGCTWSVTIDRAGAAGLSIAVDLAVPALEGLNLAQDTVDVFEPIEVAGHPGVHADRNTGPVCTIYVAVAENQLLTTDGDFAGRQRADPCGPSRRMAELVLSNLPPLK